ncbi:hypothetical protein M404DRAFT_21878 [Pisolithus tinctorius Marx 270]|uniref:Uncharacterized protein n=1 Tax=Pisolithus tinctorius Marx 270 TaxID=870435 RepID=A0A0C3PP41_PISTI|nr:hypothetical protein M404DRAFT_21878 [Pisolithus tinctorius Marx 270]
MSNPAQSRSIEWTSFDYFVIWADSGPGQTEERLLVHCEQIRSFFMYDRVLQRNEGDPLDVPAGYRQFREAYHHRATTRSRFAYLEPGMGHRIVITGPAPTREEVLGADADLCSREEIEGGQRGLDTSAIAPSEVIRTAEIVEDVKYGVSEDAIKYDTNEEEETMRAKAKERKRRKAAEQARREEQARLEAERVVREQAEAERAEREKAEAEKAAWEAEERRVREEEERWEAERRHKAETGKGDEAGGEVKKVVMDPGCTRCAQANIVCEFVVDSNKKRMACVCCNLSKGKCRWPGDGKDTEAGPKAIGKGKKRKVDEENAEAGPSTQKRVKTSAKLTEVLDLDEPEAGTVYPSGLEEKLEQLIDTVGMIANNLAGLFKLQEAVVENSGCIADALESLLDKSYGFGMAVSPSDLGSSELDSDELCEEAEWLKNHGEDNEEETEGEDKDMAEGE